MSSEWWPWFWAIVGLGLVGIVGYSSTMLMRIIDQRIGQAADEIRQELAQLRTEVESLGAAQQARLEGRLAELENRIDHAERVLPAGTDRANN